MKVKDVKNLYWAEFRKEVSLVAKLTSKQEKFVQGVISGLSQREAYRQAYPSSIKWTDNAVDVNACKLLNNAKVLLRYNELRDRLVKEAEDECIVTAKDVLRELKKIGTADIRNYLEYRTVKTVVDHDPHTDKPIIDYQQVIDVIDSKDVDTSVIQEVSIGKDGTFKFKLYDKQRALELLGKHLGMFKDRVEVSGELDTGFNKLNSILDQLKED